MYDRPYALTRRVSYADVPTAAQATRQALATEGFGVLSEIDIQATLKAKLDVDRRPYLILGACNPALAHEALQAEPTLGVFLPCNVDVFEGEDGAVYVQAVHPQAMFSLVNNVGVSPIAHEVTARLERVLDQLAEKKL